MACVSCCRPDETAVTVEQVIDPAEAKAEGVSFAVQPVLSDNPEAEPEETVTADAEVKDVDVKLDHATTHVAMAAAKEGGALKAYTDSRVAELEAQIEDLNAKIPRPSCWMYPVYYFQAFFAAWFGAKNFDQDGDGDFDTDDLLISCRVKGVKEKILKKRELNLKITEIRKIELALEKARAELKEAGSGDLVEVEDLGEILGKMSGILKIKSSKTASLTKLVSKKDKNNDGVVTVEDVFGVLEAEVEGERADDIKAFKRWWITYIPLQCLVAAGLWLVYAFLEPGPADQELVFLKAGLDNVWPGDTDLRLVSETGCKSTFWEVWRWWSYQYTHVGPSHIGMNCLLTLAFGLPLEGQNGCFRMILVFNMGVFGGACFSWVTDPLDVVVGMSGGVYSLMGMFFADLIMNWAQKKFRLYQLLFIAILLGGDVLNYNMTQGDVKASHSAHFGGWCSGLLGGILLVKNFVKKKREIFLGILAFIAGGVISTGCIIWTASHFPPESIWKGAVKKSGYCWIRMISNFTYFEDYDWHCVKCGAQSCIDRYYEIAGVYNASVKFESCEEKYGGFHEDPLIPFK